MTRSLRWRRHRKLVIAYVLVVAALIGVFGTARITAITTAAPAAPRDAIVGRNIEGTVAPFDDRVAHSIRVEYDARDYRRMIRTFRRDRTKDYIDATVTIDGTRIEHVGIRLKGNSTLFGIDAGFRGGGPPIRGGAGPGGPGPGGGGFAPRTTASEPERLPWLIVFDHFVAGQRYEDYERIAVRVGGGSTPQTALNEALSLKLIRIAGEPAPKAAYASFAVNDRKPVLRLYVEEPMKRFVDDNFEHDGVLYKSLSTSSFEYRGDDPLLYEEDFRQITGKKQHDLRPLIDLLRWTSNASERSFAAGFAERVDVDSFSRYVALQNLLMNFDDMAGPGANYYLWYDVDTKRFTVVTWDMNLSLRGSAQQGPFDAAGFGGPGRFGREANPLKQRFLDAPAFRQTYLRAYREVYDRLLSGGRAVGELRRLEETIDDVEGAASVPSEGRELERTLRERTAALRSALS